MALNNTQLLEKWETFLDLPDEPKFSSLEKKITTARLFENSQNTIASSTDFQVPHPFQNMSLNEDGPTNQTSGVSNYDPVMISLLRRATPQLSTFDIMGVQPMTGPTGSIFYLRAKYGKQDGQEALFNEANTGWASVRHGSGNTAVLGDAGLNVGTAPTGSVATYNFQQGMLLQQAEALGAPGNTPWAEMAITIETGTVTALSRKLKAEYTHEFAQDLKAIHGLDAVNELSNVLTTELTSEINREAYRTVYGVASIGSPSPRVATPGLIDVATDCDGRWSAEKWVGLNMHIQLEANDMLKTIRRGSPGNILITSSNVASALAAAKILDIRDALQVQIANPGNNFAGTIGRIKVYIDPYTVTSTGDLDFLVVGYKGQNAWDSGIYYCPYTPMQQIRSLTQDTLTPIVGFHTRQAFANNPFAGGDTPIPIQTLTPNSNKFYRLSMVKNII